MKPNIGHVSVDKTNPRIEFAEEELYDQEEVILLKEILRGSRLLKTDDQLIRDTSSSLERNIK